MIEKMRKKLSGCKANTLSFAGRVTVAQTSLASIPGYVLQSTPIPAAVCEEAERICRDFLWGSTADARKCHLINWETICRPKDEGGLGFRSLSLLNQAYMMKLAWGLVATPSKFWVRVLRAKYSCGPAAVPNVQNRNNASALWRAIVGTWEGVKKNLNWVIRDGQGVRFWKDAWLPGWPNMHEELGDNVPVAELDFPVSYYAHGGAWNWSKIRPFLAADICNRIAVVQPPPPPFLAIKVSLVGLVSLLNQPFCFCRKNETLMLVRHPSSSWRGVGKVLQDIRLSCGSSVMTSCSLMRNDADVLEYMLACE